MGTSYLRQCESTVYAQNKILKVLNVHGTTGLVLRDIQCDYDGNYGSYSVTGGTYVFNLQL